jgi:hypothetical protein
MRLELPQRWLRSGQAMNLFSGIGGERVVLVRIEFRQDRRPGELFQARQTQADYPIVVLVERLAQGP